MWYIFREKTCTARCDFKPDEKDLARRSEIAIESKSLHSISDIQLIEGRIQPKTKTTEEKLRLIRRQRDGLLAETDWTDTLSAKTRLGEEKYSAWQEYRQALRDFPETCDLDNPAWPLKPGVK
jgi:hypothetical protein